MILNAFKKQMNTTVTHARPTYTPDGKGGRTKVLTTIKEFKAFIYQKNTTRASGGNTYTDVGGYELICYPSDVSGFLAKDVIIVNGVEYDAAIKEDIGNQAEVATIQLSRIDNG